MADYVDLEPAGSDGSRRRAAAMKMSFFHLLNHADFSAYDRQKSDPPTWGSSVEMLMLLPANAPNSAAKAAAQAFNQSVNNKRLTRA